MKRTALIALFTALLCSDARADQTSATQPATPARDIPAAALRIASISETLNEQMTRLAVRPATLDQTELTPEEKLALLLFVSAARQSAQRP
jgi:hypothetical protein